MKTYKAIINPTISGGNIEVKISANSPQQAREIIKTLPYFKSFASQPTMINESKSKISQLTQLAHSTGK